MTQLYFRTTNEALPPLVTAAARVLKGPRSRKQEIVGVRRQARRSATSRRCWFRRISRRQPRLHDMAVRKRLSEAMIGKALESDTSPCDPRREPGNPGSRLGRYADIEDERIIAGSADQDIVTGAAGDDVVAVAAVSVGYRARRYRGRVDRIVTGA